MNTVITKTKFNKPEIVGEPEAVASLSAKILAVATAKDYVEKSGRNSFHKYDYVTENDLLDAIRDALEAEGVMIFTSVAAQQIVETETKKGQTEFLTVVVTSHTFIDSETGAQITVYSQGQGADKGDKGVYKAITGANKYFLYKTMLKSAGDDPEGDSGTDRRRSSGGGGRKKQSRRKPRRKSRKSKKSKFVSAEDRKRLLKFAKSEYGMTVSDVQEVLTDMGIEASNKIPVAKAGEVKSAIESAGGQS